MSRFVADERVLAHALLHEGEVLVDAAVVEHLCGIRARDDVDGGAAQAHPEPGAVASCQKLVFRTCVAAWIHHTVEALIRCRSLACLTARLKQLHGRYLNLTTPLTCREWHISPVNVDSREERLPIECPKDENESVGILSFA